MASTAEVIRPNPIEASSRLTAAPRPQGLCPPGLCPPGLCPPGQGPPRREGLTRTRAPDNRASARDRAELGGGDVPDHLDRAGRAVGVDLEDARRDVVRV